MKKKQIIVLSILFVVGLVLCGGSAVEAQSPTPVSTPEEEGVFQLPKPGIGPDSPLYFLDKMGERVGMFFAFSAEAKAKRSLANAEERLAEAEAMADKGKDELAEKTVQEYGKMVSKSASALAQSAKKGGDVDEALADLVEKATGIHQQVLTEVYEKVPAQAKQGIERAMEESARGQKEALEALSGEKRQEMMKKIQERRQKREQMPPQVPGVPEGTSPGREGREEEEEVPGEEEPEQRGPVELPTRTPQSPGPGEEVPSGPGEAGGESSPGQSVETPEAAGGQEETGSGQGQEGQGRP